MPHSDLDGSGLELRVLVLEPGASEAPREVANGRGEVLYVLTGTAELQIDDATYILDQDGAARVPGGTAYVLRGRGEGPCEIALVSGRAGPEAATPGPVCLDLADQSRHPAVSEREFQLLFHPETGCTGMTQFVGYVPTVRTPRHTHPYSEMLCIVRGSGLVEIDGQETQVGPGCCYYLPAGTPHLVQNSGEELLVELGVFTPAGSPTQNTPVA
ncbi:MAG TPA: cupin domain-containing protein [Flexivirga sp.]|nr:cupin domain-containing protein [Flexivirga sp.]